MWWFVCNFYFVLHRYELYNIMETNEDRKVKERLGVWVVMEKRPKRMEAANRGRKETGQREGERKKKLQTETAQAISKEICGNNAL